MHKIVLGKKILSFIFPTATVILFILFAFIISSKVPGTAIKQVRYALVYNINLSKNIKCTTDKQAGKLIRSDIRKQMVIVVT